MQWSPGNRGDIDDERGRSGGFGVAHLGIGGFLVLLVLSWLSGTNLFTLLGTNSSAPSQPVGTTAELASPRADHPLVAKAATVTKDGQRIWAAKLGSRYRRPKL